jgi:hypothetical protein
MASHHPSSTVDCCPVLIGSSQMTPAGNYVTSTFTRKRRVIGQGDALDATQLPVAVAESSNSPRRAVRSTQRLGWPALPVSSTRTNGGGSPNGSRRHIESPGSVNSIRPPSGTPSVDPSSSTETARAASKLGFGASLQATPIATDPTRIAIAARRINDGRGAARSSVLATPIVTVRLFLRLPQRRVRDVDVRRLAHL